MTTTHEGIRIINADKDFKFETLAEDIVNGIPLDPERCAGAIACTRSFPGAIRAKFFKSRTYVLCRIGPTEELIWLRYGTPKNMKVLEAINDVVVKDIEAAKKYAGPIVIKALPESKRTERQQGSDTRPPSSGDNNPPKAAPRHIPMRQNAPTSDT